MTRSQLPKYAVRGTHPGQKTHTSRRKNEACTNILFHSIKIRLDTFRSSPVAMSRICSWMRHLTVLIRDLLKETHAKQGSAKNTHESTAMLSHQRAQRWNRHIISGHMASFTIWSHRCIQTRQMSMDTNNYTFPILLKHLRSGLKTYQTKRTWPK
jgi:hypothetical protein